MARTVPRPFPQRNAVQLDLELGDRLSVLTGDNGLGKTFVLDVAWWLLTGGWVGRPVLPRAGSERDAQIAFRLEPAGDVASLDGPANNGFRREHVAKFSRTQQDWDDSLAVGLGSLFPAESQQMRGWLADNWRPVLYARADGTFSVWDPVRNYPIRPSAQGARAEPRPYHFTVAELWDGLELDGKPAANGMIQDWTRWWLEAAGGKRSPFHLLRDVMRRLSQPLEPMEPGEPRRLYLDDSRDFPTVDLPYGNVSIAHLSAGMKRILSLAYLIVWAWSEHEKACELLGRKPAEGIVFLMDEVESHLHPQWQRHILPSLMEVLCGLGGGIRPQLLVTTHSPLVLASLEPHFSLPKDKLFLFELAQGQVSLREVPWARWGDATGWLTWSSTSPNGSARTRSSRCAVSATR
jgi:hypothetical protein